MGKKFKKFSTFYKIKTDVKIHCPMTLLIWRDIDHCHDCEYFEELKIDKVRCSYPYPDKRWFWKRQTNDGDPLKGIPPYPKKLKVKTKT